MENGEKDVLADLTPFLGDVGKPHLSQIDLCRVTYLWSIPGTPERGWGANVPPASCPLLRGVGGGKVPC